MMHKLNLKDDSNSESINGEDVDRPQKLLLLLAQIGEAIFWGGSRAEWFDFICRKIVATELFAMAFVVRVNPENQKYTIVSKAGSIMGWEANAGSGLQVRLLQAVEDSVRQKKTWIQNRCNEETIRLSTGVETDLDSYSIAATPILNGSETFGALAVIGQCNTCFRSEVVFALELCAGVMASSLANLPESEHGQTGRKELKKPHMHFREIFECNGSIMLLIDPQNNIIIDANNSAVEFYGYPRDKLLGMHMSEINTLPRFDCGRIAREVALGERGYSQFNHRLSSGEIRIIEAYTNPVEINGRTLNLATIHDITKRRKAEQELQQTLLKTDSLNNLLNTTHLLDRLTAVAEDYHGMVDKVCKLLVGNPTYVGAWVGIPTEEDKSVIPIASAGVVIETLKDLRIRWDDGPSGNGPTGKAIRSKRVVVFNDLMNDPQFAPWREKIIASQVKAIAGVALFQSGSLWGELTLMTDNSEAFNQDEINLLEAMAASIGGALDRISKKKALEESEKRFRKLVEALPVAIFLTSSKDDKFEYLNPKATEMFGYTCSETPDLKEWWLRAYPNSDYRQQIQKQLRNQIQQAERQGTDPESFIAEVNCKNGTQKKILWSYRPVGDKQLFYGIDLTMQLAMESAKARLAAIVESSNDAIIGEDMFGIIQSWNKGAERIFGYGAAEMVGQTAQRLIPEKHRLETDFLLKKTVRGHRTHDVRTKRLCKDGRIIYVSAAISPIIDSDGNVIGVSKVERDITSAYNDELRLRMFYKATESNPCSILITDPAGKIEYVNPRFTEITGYTSAEVCGQFPRLFKSGVHSDAEYKKIWSTITDGKVWRGELVNKKKDGSLHTEFMEIAPVKDTRGRIVNFVAVRDDITQKKQAENERRRLATAIDQSMDSIVFTDLDGKIIYVNQGFEKCSGYKRQEVIGQNPRLLKGGKHDVAFYQSIWAQISQGRVWSGRFTNRRKDGTLYEEDAIISPVHDDAGVVSSYVAVMRDVTREISLESQLIQAQKMEAIGQLAGGVAHDFNNILAVSMIHICMLLGKPLPDPGMRELLLAIQRGNERAANLTRQLLMFSRRQAMQKTALDVHFLLFEEIKLLRRLIGEHIHISLQSHPGVCAIEADAGMIEQVIMNLCINARDAMPKGGNLMLSAKLVELTHEAISANLEARKGQFVEISVADDGCGMSPDTVRRIFEPFFTTKEIGQGTGLGLATVYGIVKQHEGWVEVESSVGKGSKFKVYLPACPIPNISRLTETSEKPDIKGKETILFVEDEDSLRKALTIWLERLGFKVHSVNNGVEALNLWKDRIDKVDILITDMIMPGGMSGLELANSLKKIRPDLPILIMSGYSKELTKNGLHENSSLRFLSKPCTPAELSEVVRKMLDQARPHAD